MSRAARARRVAAAAAYGGGGIGLAGMAAYGVLAGQARLARRAIPMAETELPCCDGLYGTDHHGEPIVLAVLGDSSAAGYGVDHARDTPGALLAAGLAEVVEQPVRLVCRAAVGALSADLHGQADAVLPERPAVTVIMIGGNDVTHRVPAQDAVRHLDEVVHRLVDSGSQVVVGTCPDLGTIEPIQPPLRWLARRWSRTLAAAQTITVVQAGGRSVSLGDLLGPEFSASPREMFSADRFHPSAEGYSAAAAAVLPSVAASLGLWDPVEDVPSTERGEAVLPLPDAAVEAADHAGTEVSGSELAGRDRGIWGRWAQLRRRIRLFTDHPADPAPASEADIAPVARRHRRAFHCRARSVGVRVLYPGLTPERLIRAESTRTPCDMVRRRYAPTVNAALASERPFSRTTGAPTMPGSTVPEAVIVATARTPIGRAFKGSWSTCVPTTSPPRSSRPRSTRCRSSIRPRSTT